MKLSVLVLCAALILAAACGGAATPITETAAQPLVSLPADEAPHDATIEWWYFNGLLTDDRGREYSYHYVTFQSAATRTAVPRLLQASLGDHTAGEHLTGEKVLLSALDESATGIDVSVGGWSMNGNGGTYNLVFDLAEYSLDLNAVSTKPPVLHQGNGLVSLGPVGDTYYYTRPRLDLAGTMTINGEARPVTGVAWMDHQWGDVEGRRVGWDWVSLQLDDATDLMVVLVWDPSDRTPIARYGTLILANGPALILAQDDVSIMSHTTWTSPATRVTYPSGWTVTSPSLDLNLVLEPVLLDSEFAGSRYTPAAYWEGEVRATGTSQGRSVSGRGFVELVGYDPRQLGGAAASP
ncbi:MAG: hypothetical protein BZY87_10715 [SAR202 cluster bacterium Io17-Chloro-G6]|nr:MAG: hypothetical protein BZY87_10715 [SAR202 cluster bacterium Io17-Chloro-G6]